MEIVLLIYLGFLFAVLTHEAGHALAVLWVGHSLTEFSVGPISFQKSITGYSFKLRAELLSGLVRYERQVLKTSWLSEILIVGGGVAANFLGAIVATVIYVYFSDNALYVFVCIIFTIVAIVSLIPVRMKKKGLDSDGRRLMDLMSFTKSIKKYRSTYSSNIELVKKCPLNFSEKTADASAVEIEFFNDDITPMFFVVDILISNFEIDDFSAAVIMFEIHENGMAKVGWFDHNIAGTCVERMNQQAMSNGYPFFCRTT